MAKLRINGDSSGYVDLEAPNAASSSTLDLDQVPQKNATTTAFTGSVGIGETSPFAKLHVSNNQTGRTSADSVGNLLVLEDYENGMSILSANAGAGYILFGDQADTAAGAIAYDHSADRLRFRVNSSWDKMVINASGHVTKPQQPAFESYLGSSWTLSNSTIVPFNTLSYSTGNHYDASNYKFTAPIDGKYLFYIHTYTSATVGNIRALHFKWNVNGNQHRDLTHGGYSADGGTAYHPPITGTIILNLSAGDYVQVYFSGGGYSGGNVYLGATQSYWGGYLLG